MSHYQTTWRLPTEVETDCASPESRVPLLGLHTTSHPVDTDLNQRNMEHMDSLCDSGLGSLSCGGFPLQNSVSHEVDQTLEQFHKLRVTSHCPNAGLKRDKPDSNSVLYNSHCDDGFESIDSIGLCDSDHSQELTKLNMDIINQIFSRDEDGDTQLHMAIIHECRDVALQMIDLAPSQEYLNIQNNLHQTALHLAACTGLTSVVRKLVARGAQVDVQDHHGNTALHIACRTGNAECVRSLTQPVSNQELKDCPYQPVFQKLPQDPEIKNYEGETCLHLAASQGHLEVMVYLLSAKVGANVNTPDGRSGRTILHHAIETKCFPTLALALRLATVDVNAKTFNGVTPLQIAKSRESNDIVKALIARGARVEPLGIDSDCDSTWCDSEEEYMDV